MFFRLNCAAGSVHTGSDFYQAFGIGYSEVQASDTQGYDIMKHYASQLFFGLEIGALG